MDDCYQCGYRNGGHSDACYEHPNNTANRELLKRLYDAGYADGRAGRNPASMDNAYLLGYGRGVVAHEAWFNGGPNG